MSERLLLLSSISGASQLDECMLRDCLEAIGVSDVHEGQTEGELLSCTYHSTDEDDVAYFSVDSDLRYASTGASSVGFELVFKVGKCLVEKAVGVFVVRGDSLETATDISACSSLEHLRRQLGLRPRNS